MVPTEQYLLQDVETEMIGNSHLPSGVPYVANDCNGFLCGWIHCLSVD